MKRIFINNSIFYDFFFSPPASRVLHTTLNQTKGWCCASIIALKKKKNVTCREWGGRRRAIKVGQPCRPRQQQQCIMCEYFHRVHVCLQLCNARLYTHARMCIHHHLKAARRRSQAKVSLSLIYLLFKNELSFFFFFFFCC